MKYLTNAAAHWEHCEPHAPSDSIHTDNKLNHWKKVSSFYVQCKSVVLMEHLLKDGEQLLSAKPDLSTCACPQKCMRGTESIYIYRRLKLTTKCLVMDFNIQNSPFHIVFGGGDSQCESHHLRRLALFIEQIKTTTTHLKGSGRHSRKQRASTMKWKAYIKGHVKTLWLQI